MPSKFQAFLLHRLFFANTPFSTFQEASNPAEHQSPKPARAAADTLCSPPSQSRTPKFPGVTGWLPGPTPAAPRARDRPPLPYAAREAILAVVLSRLARASARAAACAPRPWTAGARPGDCMRSAATAPRRSALEHAQLALRGRPGEVPEARG